MRKSKNFWTKEECQKEALKYNSRSEFRKNSKGAYSSANKNGWLNDICNHMIILINKWTKESCQEEALKYKNRSYFCEKSAGAYRAAIKLSILDEICVHMIKNNKNLYWTKERCQEEALNYTYRNDFRKNSKGAYPSAHKNGWLNDICSHMKNIGNKFKRCVYVYEFSDNYVYIGLTFNINKRNIQHINAGPVYKHIKINSDYELKILTDYICVDDAKKKEIYYIEKYKKDNYNLLNTHKGGEIGGSTLKWTFEACLDEAKKCKNLSEYRKCKSYYSVWKNKWTNNICEICKFDISQIKPKH